MTRTIGILGSDAATARLRVSLRSRRVDLERHSFRYMDEVLGFLNENPDIGAVLLNELGLKENHPNVIEALEMLRDTYPTVRIILIMELPDRRYGFELWCYERHIYDIFYPNRHTDIDIDAIGTTICMGRIDPGNPPPPPDDPNAAPEPEEGFLDKLKGFSLPEIKLPSLPNLSEFIKRRKTETPPHAAVPPVSPIKTIGIINTSRGMGATSLAVAMADCLFTAGCSVAVLAMDLKLDLAFSKLADIDVTISIPQGDMMADWVKLAFEHQHLIIDFGIIYEYLPSGKPIPAQSRAKEACAVQEAYDFCDLRIYLSSDAPWHRNKADEFRADAQGFFIDAHEADASNILQRLGVIR